MSSQTQQRFVTLAIIVTLSISIWSGYLYSQAYRLSQDSNVHLAEVSQDMREMDVLVNEATSRLDAANRVFADASRKMEEAKSILRETEVLLSEVRNHGIVNITSMSIEQKPQIQYLNGEALLATKLTMNISSPSRFPVYYESSIVDTAESTVNLSGRMYKLVDFAKVSNVQTNSENPLWDEKSTVLGTDVSQVTFWIGLRSLAFQRQGIVLVNPKENVKVRIDLRIQILQAHTNLVMHQITTDLDFEFGPDGQTSARLIG